MSSLTRKDSIAYNRNSAHVQLRHMFTPVIYMCSVIQDLSIGTAVRQFEAIDIDTDDTTFSYDIRVSDSRAAALTIDRGTGMISTYTSLTNLGQRRFTAKVTGQCLLLNIAIITKIKIAIETKMFEILVHILDFKWCNDIV